MKKKASDIPMKSLEDFGITASDYRDKSIARIIDQTKFDYKPKVKQAGVSLAGGCQSAILFSGIESFLLEQGIEYEISYGIMRKFLIDMDKFWGGKGEKIENAMRYLALKGITLPNLGIVKAIDLGDLAPKDATFNDLSKAIKGFDCVGLTFKIATNFFSGISGTYGMKSYSKTGTRPTVGFHAMRAAYLKNVNGNVRAVCPNSWGVGWPSSPKELPGCGFIAEDKFDGMGFSEVKFCRFTLERF